METTSVLTGDIVNSRSLSPGEREKLYASLKEFLAAIKKQKLIKGYEVFRGDSFQCLGAHKENILRVALQIRAFIKSSDAAKPEKPILKKRKKTATKGYFPGKQDIRIGLGIGKADFINNKSLAHSDGEAFQFAGETLDRLKKEAYRMMIKTNDEKFNQLITPGMLLLDAVIQKWTHNQAELALLKLQNLTEEEIATKLNISQSAVNQRTKTAQWYAIEKLIAYFEETIKTWK